MPVRIVFTRNDKSIISRAIMWFSQHRRKPETRCSHVLFKFRPGGICSGWWAYEAMERGCWMTPWKKSAGGQTIVAEFELDVHEAICDKVMPALIDETCGDWYDFVGIWKWAWWVIAERCFGTIVRLLKITFRPGRMHDGAFCSGLVLEGLRKFQSEQLSKDFGIAMLTPRTSSPQNEIDVCLSKPDVYVGTLGPLKD